MKSPESESGVRILLVDDHGVVRTGLRHLLEAQPGWKVCGEADRGSDGVTLAAQLQPNVAILDMSVPGMTGMETSRHIKKSSPQTEFIIYTAHETEDLVHAVFDAGGRSFLLKTDDPSHVINAVSAAAQHKPYFTPRVSEIIYARLSRGSSRDEKPLPGSALTERERQTIHLVAEGKTNKDVASALGISLRTAEAHRAALMKKLNLHTVGEVVRFAIRNQIIEA